MVIENLSVSVENKVFKGSFEYKVFKEGEFWIGYIESIDVSSYAETKEKAIEFLKSIYLKDFLESISHQPEIATKLFRGLNWKES